MTSISQYLKAERPDPTEPVSFYVPGLNDWAKLKTAKGRALMATRSVDFGLTVVTDQH